MTIKGKELLEQIKDKEFNQDILDELEKYEIKKPKTAYDVNYGDDYYTLDFENSEWKCLLDNWWGLSGERRNRALGIVHLTKERAELHARVLNTELAVKEFKRKNDDVELDWSNTSQKKYFVRFHNQDKYVEINYWKGYKCQGVIYMSSENLWAECIEEVSEERIIEWLKWEDINQ